MIKTALDKITMPPVAKLLGWQLLDARPADGWLKLGFEGKPEFLNPAGFVQGGILSAMLDDTMGQAVLVMTEGRSARDCTEPVRTTTESEATTRPSLFMIRVAMESAPSVSSPCTRAMPVIRHSASSRRNAPGSVSVLGV